jgi:hypothetical protein
MKYSPVCSDKHGMVGQAAWKTIPPPGDPGYVIHQVLTETFGLAAPKPFHFFETQNFKLLTYSSCPASESRY